jgi:PEP-CTERM motif
LNYRGRITAFPRLILGGIFLGALHATAASASPVVVDFDGIDALGGRLVGAPVLSYLASYGISFSTSYPLIQPAIYAYPFYIAPVSGPNYFGPDGMATFYTYNLGFSTPLDSFGFTRPGLGSATMAQWTATAYSAADTVLGSVGENMLFSGAPAATFTLNGPGIDHVQFSSDAHSWAGLNLSVDNLELATSVPEPPTWPLLLVGLFGLGAFQHLTRRKTQRI